MRSRSLLRRWGATVAVLLSVATGLGAAGATSSFASNACNSPFRSTNLGLKQTASKLPSGNVAYRLDVTNFGPDCANEVTTTSLLPTGSTLVGFTSLIRNWICSGASTAICTLQSTLPSPPGNSNFAAVSIETTAPISSSEPNHTTLTATVADLEPTDNVSDAGYSSSMTVGDCSSSTKPQVTTARNDHPSGIETQFPSAISEAGEPDPPCGSNCLFSSELNNVTEGTDPKLWPKVHLTFTVCLTGLFQEPSGTISRFNDKTGQWVANLPSCSGFKGDTDLGCTKSISFRNGTWIWIGWTTRNGHLAK
jgi:uncharacterized repeat protein (TIGR01451 family)